MSMGGGVSYFKQNSRRRAYRGKEVENSCLGRSSRGLLHEEGRVAKGDDETKVNFKGKKRLMANRQGVRGLS